MDKKIEQLEQIGLTLFSLNENDLFLAVQKRTAELKTKQDNLNPIFGGIFKTLIK